MVWTLRKNCMLTPKQSAVAFGAAGLASLVIGVAWASIGIWFIFYFAVLECMALLIAFLLYSFHATDFERVVLTEDNILFEFERGGKRKRDSLPRHLVTTRMNQPEDGNLIEFKRGSKIIAIGQYVDLERRQKFFGEIKGYLC